MANYSFKKDNRLKKRMAWVTVVNCACVFILTGILIYTLVAG